MRKQRIWLAAVSAAVFMSAYAVSVPYAAVPSAASTAAKEQEAQTNKFGFTYKEVRYEVGADAGEAMKTLGKEKSSREVNTCANGYVNRAYTYGENDKDFEVYVEQNESTGKDMIASITLMTANVATEEGLKVGDGETEITKIYPAAVKGFNSYKVKEGKELLYIKLSGKKVSYISYTVTE